MSQLDPLLTMGHFWFIPFTFVNLLMQFFPTVELVVPSHSKAACVGGCFVARRVQWPDGAGQLFHDTVVGGLLVCEPFKPP